jgi:hypothetical protein
MARDHHIIDDTRGHLRSLVSECVAEAQVCLPTAHRNVVQFDENKVVNRNMIRPNLPSPVTVWVDAPRVRVLLKGRSGRYWVNMMQYYHMDEQCGTYINETFNGLGDVFRQL